MKIRLVHSPCLQIAGALALTGFLALPAVAQQASITLLNSDVAYCYKQQVSWSLTKTNDHPTANVGDTVNWTIKATKGAAGPKTLCAVGYVSVQNTGSADATIGNIVVDLQRNLGKPAKWTAISADVADGTYGDGATSDKIVAAALQGQTTYTGVATTSGAAATFTENALSGSLEFTDGDSNTIWNISPARIIAVGETVNLYFTAVFNVNSLNIPAGEQLRTEVFVTFGSAGTRGGSGATAQNIDINGNGGIDTDEANVRTVPTRVTKALPAVEICNNSVTITDTFATTLTAGFNLTTNPIGTGVTASATTTYSLIGTVTGTGTVVNTADLQGADSSVTLSLGNDPVTGLPLTTTLPCCVGQHLTASSTVNVDLASPPDDITGVKACSYSQGGFQGGGVPGALYTNNFISTFPSGLRIGLVGASYHDALWNATVSGRTALKTFLAGGGPSGALTADTTDSSSVSGGTLAKQTAALALNIGFGAASLFTPPNIGIGALKYKDPGNSLDGLTVTQILQIANDALGGVGLPAGYTFGTLNALIENLNLSFHECVLSTWATTHLVP